MTPRTLAVVALLSLPLPVLARTVDLPPGFDGIYVPDGAACGDASQITVENGVMLVMDGAMSVTDLIEDPVNPRKVEATLEISASGGEWTESAVMTLAEDGQSCGSTIRTGPASPGCAATRGGPAEYVRGNAAERGLDAPRDGTSGP